MCDPDSSLYDRDQNSSKLKKKGRSCPLATKTENNTDFLGFILCRNIFSNQMNCVPSRSHLIHLIFKVSGGKTMDLGSVSDLRSPDWEMISECPLQRSV